MKNGDFIDLVTRYGSFFTEEKGKHHEVITEFINYIAAQRGVDYGLHMEELERHKRKDVVPVDVDVMIRQSRLLEDCYEAMVAIYRNTSEDRTKHCIEYIADKQSMGLRQRLDEININ